jgi:hypothetical protein
MNERIAEIKCPCGVRGGAGVVLVRSIVQHGIVAPNGRKRSQKDKEGLLHSGPMMLGTANTATRLALPEAKPVGTVEETVMVA